MNTSPTVGLRRYWVWFSTAPSLILVVGLILALVITVAVMIGLMQPPIADLTILVRTLGITSLLSLGLSYFLYRRGLARSPSLNLTLVLTYVWAALLMFVNVLVMAQEMFFNAHDLALSIVLLVFAVLLVATFGIFVAATATDGLRKLAKSTQQVAEGDLSVRVEVSGQDEVAQVAVAFNEMAARLQEAEQQRQEVENLRRDLIAWTSHDLRTPLTSIRAMIEALHDGIVDDSETTQRYYRTIRHDIVSLNELINDLFELAQLDAGGLHMDFASHSLTDLVSDTLESFGALAEQREIALNGDVGGDIDPVVMCAAKMGRVLSNLVSNALQYTPAGGEVAVLAERVTDGVQIVISDTGPGFIEEDLPKIFEKFYRGEEARSRATGGAGLGLAIARGIVEAHTGRIWAENKPTGGAKITIQLPNVR